MDCAVDVCALIGYAFPMPDTRTDLLRQLADAPGFHWDVQYRAGTETLPLVDLDDPSTRGILLDQARAAWGKPHLYVYYNAIKGVFCVGGGLPVPLLIEGPSEGEVLAHAIISAPPPTPEGTTPENAAEPKETPKDLVARLRREERIAQQKQLLCRDRSLSILWAKGEVVVRRLDSWSQPAETLVQRPWPPPPLKSLLAQRNQQCERQLAEAFSAGHADTAFALADQMVALQDLVEAWESDPPAIFFLINNVGEVALAQITGACSGNFCCVNLKVVLGDAYIVALEILRVALQSVREDTVATGVGLRSTP